MAERYYKKQKCYSSGSNTTGSLVRERQAPQAGVVDRETIAEMLAAEAGYDHAQDQVCGCVSSSCFYTGACEGIVPVGSEKDRCRFKLHRKRR